MARDELGWLRSQPKRGRAEASCIEGKIKVKEWSFKSAKQICASRVVERQRDTVASASVFFSVTVTKIKDGSLFDFSSED